MPYLAPWLRYSDLLAKNANFFHPSHLAPSFGETTIFQAADGEDLVIVACTVFD